MMSNSVIITPHNSKGAMEKLSVIKEKLSGKVVKDINLLNHIGFFCHDPKKAKLIKDPQTFIEKTQISGERIEIVYKVSPNVGFGYPSVTAFNICDIVDRLLTYHGIPAMNPIPFDMVTLRDSLKLKKTGQNNETIKNALKQLRFTAIETSHFFLDRNRKWIETTYTFFDDLVFVGERKNNIKKGLIYLNKHLVESFNNKNQLPVNLERYASLPAPAKAIYLKLFRQFSAATKTGRPVDQISVENDYDTLCKSLGLTPQKYKSLITQQLKPHFILLQDVANLISKWSILHKKNKDGYKIKSYIGQGHIEDHKNFNKKSENGQLKLEFRERDTENVPEIEAVRYFLKKQFGISPGKEEADHINPKDTAFAKEILKFFPDKKIYEFIDYGVQEAKSTDFKIKTFRGLIGFIDAFKAIDITKKKHTETKKTLKDVLDKEEEVKKLYSQFINETYNIYLESLKPKEKEKHEQEIQNKVISDYKKIFRKEPNENSQAYIGLKENTITNFTETTLTKDIASDFRNFLETQGKNNLLDVKPVDLRLK